MQPKGGASRPVQPNRTLEAPERGQKLLPEESVTRRRHLLATNTQHTFNTQHGQKWSHPSSDETHWISFRCSTQIKFYKNLALLFIICPATTAESLQAGWTSCQLTAGFIIIRILIVAVMFTMQ